MIALDFFHLFKTDPNSTKVPRIVFDWVTEREKQFSNIEFKISFSDYQSEEEKKLLLKYERIYGPSLINLRNVTFPLKKGCWTVRLIGDQEMALDASDLIEILDRKDARIEFISSENERVSPRGYTRLEPITDSEEEMVDIRCDRNINDEWEFRGTGQEFIDEKVKTLLN